MSEAAERIERLQGAAVCVGYHNCLLYTSPYGWGVAEYATPEELFGYDLITSAYQREPQESKEMCIRDSHTSADRQHE